ALRDPATLAATLAAVRALAAQPGGLDEGEPLFAFLTVGGRQVGNVVFARLRGGRGAPAQVVGVTYDRALSTAAGVEAARWVLPALPPALGGGAGEAGGAPTPARVVRRLDDVTPGATEVRMPDGTRRRDDSRRFIGTRFLSRAGQTLYATPGWDAARWRTPYRASVTYDSRPGGYVLEMGVDAADGERLARAAVPADGAWAAAALAAMALLFAAASGVGLRRERQLERLRARFVASVSHELRTPLTQITVFSDMLLRDDGGGDAPTARRWLGIINREAHRLALMVEGALLTARDEGGRLRIARRACDAMEIADDVRVAMTPVAAARGSTLRVAGPAAWPAHVDPGALRQVLLNLVDNALKYGPEGQTVTVALRAPGDDGALIATVDDEGPGVAPADRARVWRPYERLERDDGVSGGSGLGLSVVRTLVAQHGGAVAVDGAPAGGARFRVTIPRAAATPEGAATAAAVYS
ncbi:HAMP domain-containing sensor histidine kinase, partial [Roseisolibacter sp. H3M3-2]|uniref:sensor histidine kinase n=1 Tax=Roseisolibacter sp. H3M3-2 TaxID=3031323 RepID=UPI0023DBAB80